MTGAANSAEERGNLLTRLFPDGVPTIWCPLITHYDEEAKRNAALPAVAFSDRRERGR